MRNIINFYKVKGEKYGCFSNFSCHKFIFDNLEWKHSEGCFQAQKFAGINPERYEHIHSLWSPKAAAEAGRDKSFQVRNNWDKIRVRVMYEVVKAKFSQNDDIKQILLSTCDAILIENSPIDYFWGCGADGSGENYLGRILMRIRDEFMMENN